MDRAGRATLASDAGRAFKRTRVHLYVADLDARVVTLAGELLRHLIIDPRRIYQGRDREAY